MIVVIVCSWIAEERGGEKVLNKLANCTAPERQSKQSGTHLASGCVFSHGNVASISKRCEAALAGR